MADRGVLAKDTGEGTSGKKHRSRAASCIGIPADAGLLAFMQRRPCHHRPIRHTAKARSFARCTRRPASAGTESTDGVSHKVYPFFIKTHCAAAQRVCFPIPEKPPVFGRRTALFSRTRCVRRSETDRGSGPYRHPRLIFTGSRIRYSSIKAFQTGGSRYIAEA